MDHQTIFTAQVCVSDSVATLSPVAFKWRCGLVLEYPSSIRGWRIHDFPDEGHQPPRWVRQSIILAIFSRKLHKIEKY